jgi:malate/lactate dehydrogenase
VPRRQTDRTPPGDDTPYRAGRRRRAYVLGEHGESLFPALSVTSVGGLRLDREDGAMRAILEETRADGHRVVRAKGYIDYAVVLSAALVEMRIM